MSLFKVNFSDRSKPIIKELDQQTIEIERDREADLLSIVETVYEAAQRGENLSELKRWAVEVWREG